NLANTPLKSGSGLNRCYRRASTLDPMVQPSWLIDVLAVRGHIAWTGVISGRFIISTAASFPTSERNNQSVRSSSATILHRARGWLLCTRSCTQWPMNSLALPGFCELSHLGDLDTTRIKCFPSLGTNSDLQRNVIPARSCFGADGLLQYFLRGNWIVI